MDQLRSSPPPTGSRHWYLHFSWDEPPGIAAHGNEENDPEIWSGTWRGVQECNLTEFVPASHRHFNHWFRRIDRLGEITAEAPPKAE